MDPAWYGARFWAAGSTPVNLNARRRAIVGLGRTLAKAENPAQPFVLGIAPVMRAVFWPGRVASGGWVFASPRRCAFAARKATDVRRSATFAPLSLASGADATTAPITWSGTNSPVAHLGIGPLKCHHHFSALRGAAEADKRIERGR
jgi:hypothetical protein